MVTLTCPINHEIMKDPVQGSDGHTYEREAIERALSYKNESPITREYMTISNLTPNTAIRFLCDKYHSGELGNLEDNAANLSMETKISNTNIKMDHNISKNGKDIIMLEFGINDQSYPIEELEFGHLPHLKV